MSAKHTPGPWEAQDRVERIAVFGAVDSGDAVEIASLDFDVEDNAETTEANAALIAAAPDLADLLNELLAAVEAETSERDGRDFAGLSCANCVGAVPVPHSLGCRIESALRKAGAR